MTDGQAPPPRVRVMRDDTAPTPTVTTEGLEDAYVRGLMRAQLRLALGCLIGFLAASAALVAVILVLPHVTDTAWFGVPVAWLLHAYGFYPLIFVFALVYVRGATLRERRYRALADDA